MATGKNSTIDRIGLHRALRDSLKLDTADCKIKKQCILEGKLLIWNDDDERIEPFHKIRKHVKRSSRFIGTARDSPVDSNKHLMIIFYDILLLDDTVCIREPHDRRRRLLESLIHCISGRADIGSREIIDFSSFDAPELLSEAFARAIARRWEGFVLKGCDDPYFSFKGTKSFIKLKKAEPAVNGSVDARPYHVTEIKDAVLTCVIHNQSLICVHKPKRIIFTTREKPQVREYHFTTGPDGTRRIQGNYTTFASLQSDQVEETTRITAMHQEQTIILCSMNGTIEIVKRNP
jgi:hypothetical protein